MFSSCWGDSKRGHLKKLKKMLSITTFLQRKVKMSGNYWARKREVDRSRITFHPWIKQAARRGAKTRRHFAWSSTPSDRTLPNYLTGSDSPTLGDCPSNFADALFVSATSITPKRFDLSAGIRHSSLGSPTERPLNAQPRVRHGPLVLSYFIRPVSHTGDLVSIVKIAHIPVSHGHLFWTFNCF